MKKVIKESGYDPFRDTGDFESNQMVGHDDSFDVADRYSKASAEDSDIDNLGDETLDGLYPQDESTQTSEFLPDGTENPDYVSYYDDGPTSYEGNEPKWDYTKKEKASPKFDVNLFVEKAMKRGFNRSQIKELLEIVLKK